MSFIDRLARKLADEICKDGKGKPVEYVMLTNRQEPLDDHGGFQREQLGYFLAKLIHDFVAAETERHAQAVDDLGKLLKLP